MNALFASGRVALRLALLAGALACAGVMARGPVPSPATQTRPEADAHCIALLKQDVKARLHDLAPTDELPKAWQQRVEAAFALSGEAYHQGLSEKEARALLDAAEKTVALWPEARRQAEVLRCEEEGRARLKEASPLEKLVVRKGAQRWLQRERARQVD